MAARPVPSEPGVIVAGATVSPVTTEVTGTTGTGVGAGVTGVDGAGTGFGTGTGVGVGVGMGVGVTGVEPPSVPCAGKTFAPASMRQRNGPFPAFAELHVQSTSAVRPLPRPTTLPATVVTVTVHGSDEESRPWKRIGPPRAPAAATE